MKRKENTITRGNDLKKTPLSLSEVGSNKSSEKLNGRFGRSIFRDPK